jgi:general secretion pathway protein G
MKIAASLSPRRSRGFTMIELVVVMAVLGLLLSIALPRYMAALDKGREKVLVNNIAQLREAIDRHYGDRGAYPDRLDDLVERRYLRAVPLNPYTEAADWVVVPPPSGQKGQVYDIRAAGQQPGATGANGANGADIVDAPAAAASEAPPP